MQVEWVYMFNTYKILNNINKQRRGEYIYKNSLPKIKYFLTDFGQYTINRFFLIKILIQKYIYTHIYTYTYVYNMYMYIRIYTICIVYVVLLNK